MESVQLELQRVKDLLADPVFFDLRNVYEPEEVEKHGIDYVGVGISQGEVETARKQAAVVSEE